MRNHIGFDRVAHFHVGDVLGGKEGVSDLFGGQESGWIAHFLFNRLHVEHCYMFHLQ